MSPGAPAAALAALLAVAALRELAAILGERSGARFRSSPGGRALLRAVAASGVSLGAVEDRLARAGMPVGSAPVLIAAKPLCAAAALVIALAAMPPMPLRFSIALAVVLPLAAFSLPDALLERRARRRLQLASSAMPDALDLLGTGLAAGRSLHTVLAGAAAHAQGPLAAELRGAVVEIECGSPAGTALGALEDRLPGIGFASLARSVERSRRYGAPLADRLLEQAAALRAEQARELSERASRAAPKIQLVVALVLVPSVLLLVGAALLANADSLLAG